MPLSELRCSYRSGLYWASQTTLRMRLRDELESYALTATERAITRARVAETPAITAYSRMYTLA